jgi:hypothetical protein
MQVSSRFVSFPLVTSSILALRFSSTVLPGKLRRFASTLEPQDNGVAMPGLALPPVPVLVLSP